MKKGWNTKLRSPYYNYSRLPSLAKRDPVQHPDNNG